MEKNYTLGDALRICNKARHNYEEGEETTALQDLFLWNVEEIVRPACDVRAQAAEKAKRCGRPDDNGMAGALLFVDVQKQTARLLSGTARDWEIIVAFDIPNESAKVTARREGHAEQTLVFDWVCGPMFDGWMLPDYQTLRGFVQAFLMLANW